MSLHRPTITERQLVRGAIYSGPQYIHLCEQEDGVWSLHLGTVDVEGHTAAEVLRELATILEEV